MLDRNHIFNRYYKVGKFLNVFVIRCRGGWGALRGKKSYFLNLFALIIFGFVKVKTIKMVGLVSFKIRKRKKIFKK